MKEPAPLDALGREETIFNAAVQLRDPAKRAVYLDLACENDPELRGRIEKLLGADARDTLFIRPLADAAAQSMAAPAMPTSAPGDSSGQVPGDRIGRHKAHQEIDEGGLVPPKPGAESGIVKEQIPERIGRYKLLQKIGEGGCGVVYMAEQEEPVRRRVALKIIKLGMDTKSVIARFEAERQALALMDHPNIAKVFDAGATEGPHNGAQASPPASSGGVPPPGPTRGGTLGQLAGGDACAPANARPLPSDGRGIKGEGHSPLCTLHSALPSGRPYFVMELVRGVKITDYCDEKNLSTQQRLELFTQVCHAIQHAHHKGIIHRDIKPSNILVTVNDGVAIPKVIDFGIAKATTDQRLTDKTVFTAFEQFIGTPAYMSPEQAEITSVDVDTRSDIYSLGVLLYELLTGRTPFDAKELLQAGLDEMRRTLREKEPERPSTRVSTLASEELTTAAKRRGLEAPKLVNVLRGDLDWIVMKCLEKDRARRYETANGLASDIQRHLSNEPVVACPPSTAYRFRKMIRRNKLAFAATACLAATVLIGLFVSTWSLIREREARKRAVAAELQQRQLRQDTQKAQAREEQQRRAAEVEELKARQNLYAADMSLAYEALEWGNLGQVRELLAKYSASNGAGLRTGGPNRDPRGWEWRNLWQRSRGDETVILSGHSNLVTFAGMLPDGRSVVSVARDGTIDFSDLNTRRPLGSVRYPDETRCGALSPDGKWLAVGGGLSSQHGYWSLWDPARRKLRFATTNSTGVRGVGFSPDSARVAVASENALEVWDVQGFRLITGISRRDVDFRHGLAFSPDGNTLAYSQGPEIQVTNSLMLWDLQSGKSSILGSLEVGSALGLAFTHDGRTLICGERSGISIWDIPNRLLQKRLTNHLEQVVSVALSPNGKLLASASGDQTVRLWDTQSWEQKRVFRGHELEVHSVTFSPDGSKFFSCGKDQGVYVWEVEPGRTDHETYTWQPGWLLMPTSPETSRQLRVQIGNGGQTAIGFFDLARCEEEGTQRSPIPFAPDEIPDFDVSGDASKLAILRADGSIEIWSTVPLAKIKLIPRSPAGARNIALGRTGVRLAVEREDGHTEILDLAQDRTITILDSLPGQEDRVGLFAPHMSFWARDTKLVRVFQEAGGLAESLEVVCLPGAESRRIRLTHRDAFNNLSLSADGALLATSAWDCRVKLWDAATGKEIHAFGGQLTGYLCLAFSPDGLRLAAGGYDGSITVWDLSSMNQVAHWKAHAKYASRICFIDNGIALMTRGSTDTQWGHWQTHIWRAPSFAEIEAAEQLSR